MKSERIDVVVSDFGSGITETVTVESKGPTFEPVKGSGDNMPIAELRKRTKALFDSGDDGIPWRIWRDLSEEELRTQYAWVADQPQALFDYLNE